MLGIQLDDFDVHNVPLLLTDQYGKFIPGANGYAQLVMAPDATHATNWLKEGTAAGITTARIDRHRPCLPQRHRAPRRAGDRRP